MRHFSRADWTRRGSRPLTEEKEGIYRRLCREDVERFRLADGLPEALDRLQARGVPMAIATGAGRGNLDFYFEAFHLERWFDWDHVIYDDGTLPGKPAPDVYLRACARLGVAAAGLRRRRGRLCRHRLGPTPPGRAPSSPSPPPIRPGHWKNCPASRRSSTIIAILCPFLTAWREPRGPSARLIKERSNWEDAYACTRPEARLRAMGVRGRGRVLPAAPLQHTLHAE